MLYIQIHGNYSLFRTQMGERSNSPFKKNRNHGLFKQGNQIDIYNRYLKHKQMDFHASQQYYGDNFNVGSFCNIRQIHKRVYHLFGILGDFFVF